MNDWKWVKLSEIIDFNPKERLLKGSISKKIAMEKIEPFTRDISEFERLEFKGGTKFRNGDTLIARITPSLENGKTAKVNLLDEDEIGFGSTEFIVARAKKGISDENFVYYLMLDPKVREVAIKSMVGTSGRQRVHLEQIGQELFEQVYYNGSPAQLGDIISTLESGSRPKGGAEIGGIPSIGAENIERFGQYDYTKEKFISLEYFKKLNRGVVHSGDVLLYKDGAYIGKVSMALDNFPHAQCAINEHVFILRPSKRAPSSFFLYFLLLYDENRQALFSRASSKAAQPGLNQTEVKTLSILLPTTEEIIKFDNTIAPIMHQIAKNANENRKLSTLRDTLLPKLLSGEIPVNQAAK